MSIVRPYLYVVLRWISLILFGYLIFVITDEEYLADYHVTAIILILAFCKTVYFVYMVYHKIMEVATRYTAFHEFLIFLIINIFNSVFSFCVDFWCLYQVNPLSFNGVNNTYSKVELIVEFLYFSLLNFSYFGFGSIMPHSLPAKVLVMLQITLSFTTLIFILADFVSLKEGIEDYLKKRREK